MRPPIKRVWALAAPMILSNLSVPLVALVDSAVIGHLPHAHQLAAVAVGRQPVYPADLGGGLFAHGHHRLQRAGSRA